MPARCRNRNCCCPRGNWLQKQIILLRGNIVNRTCGTHKNLYIYLFLRTIFGPIYDGPPAITGAKHAHRRHTQKYTATSKKRTYLLKNFDDLVLAEVVWQVGDVELRVLDVLRRRSCNTYLSSREKKHRRGEGGGGIVDRGTRKASDGGRGWWGHTYMGTMYLKNKKMES